MPNKKLMVIVEKAKKTEMQDRNYGLGPLK